MAALLAASANRLERAFEFYSLARHIGFIKNSRNWDDIACSRLDEVCTSLQPEVAAAAEARGRELDIMETVDELLAEMSDLPPS